MKIKPSNYMNVGRLEFTVTFGCPGSCRHCQSGGSANPSGSYEHVRPEYAIEAVEALSGLFRLSSVMTFGGEPLLYPEIVCAIHKKAADRGIPTRQVITSGYFTEDRGTIKNVAGMLAISGVNNLLLSVDAFHQETIPLEPVRLFAAEVAGAGIPGACLYPSWLVGEKHANPYNEKTREILRAFSGTGLPVKNNTVELSGSAARYLSGYFDSAVPDLTEACDAPSDVTGVSVDPNGNFEFCGFTIGNIYREGVAEIISRYDPYQNPYLRAVMTGGPAALLALAEENGVTPDIGCRRTTCDICQAAAKKLPCLFG